MTTNSMKGNIQPAAAAVISVFIVIVGGTAGNLRSNLSIAVYHRSTTTIHRKKEITDRRMERLFEVLRNAVRFAEMTMTSV